LSQFQNRKFETTIVSQRRIGAWPAQEKKMRESASMAKRKRRCTGKHATRRQTDLKNTVGWPRRHLSKRRHQEDNESLTSKEKTVTSRRTQKLLSEEVLENLKVLVVLETQGHTIGTGRLFCKMIKDTAGSGSNKFRPFGNCDVLEVFGMDAVGTVELHEDGAALMATLNIWEISPHREKKNCRKWTFSWVCL